MATIMSQFAIMTPTTVTTNWSTVAGYNALSVGTITINSGITVTVTSNTTYTIV